MNHRCRELIDQGYSIVTASQRQTHYLKMAYAADMLHEGKSVWRTPEILPWKVWIRQCWDDSQAQSRATRILLSSSQARLLWQSIIESSDYAKSILQVNTIVDTAMQAYETCQEWNIDIFPDGTFLNGDARAFQSWVHAYKSKLHENNWVDDSALPGELPVSGFSLDAPGIVMYGFDQLNRQQETLIDRLKDNGCEVIMFQPEHRNESTRYHGFPEPGDELMTAADWARRIIAEQADASIGIVVPDLDHRRESVAAIFDDILHPEWVVNDPGSINKLYSIAPGKPLSDYPVVHAAMEILSLGQARHSIQRLEFLLRTSFIKGAESEADKRALFYARLRETGEPAWHIKTLLEFVDHHQQYLPVAKDFVGILRELTAFFDGLPPKQPPREWSETFTIWLKLFGWPGERTLNSTEFQTVAEWREALLDLAGLGSVSGEWTYHEALEAMKKVLTDRSFQPETVETPIQISGLPGIAGMEFDYLWITGMHDLAWPGPAMANPFIPLGLQREAGVPGSSAELTVQRCQQETQALIQSTRHIVFSYAEMDEDREYRPSPILQEYLSENNETFELENFDYKSRINVSRDMETYIDELAPEFSQADNPGGGTGILADQSACPFRAFARHRLIARGLEETDIGLDPATRGSLVHAVMHGVWKRIENLENLKQLTADKLDAVIRTMVTSVIREQTKQQPETFTAEFRRLEGRRLTTLIKEWMAIEIKRPAFSIQELEKRHETTFHGLNLRMRIDRIDELQDGSLLVIDYKTGEVHTRKWEGERPEEPQLPLYAVTIAGNVRAMVFAGMKKGKLGFVGLSAGPDLLDGVKPVSELVADETWEHRLKDWEQVLGSLAEEYLKGHASVTPRDNQACTYCDLHSLCRIHEHLESPVGLSNNKSQEAQD